MTRSHLSLALLALALALPARAGVLDDDLAVVRHAVAEAAPNAGPQVGLQKEVVKVEKEEGLHQEPARQDRPAAPRWLRVRVQEKGSVRPTVSVNLPLSLLRALTDEEPLEWLEDLGVSSRRSLGSADDLVRIEDEEQSVRVWVE
jgi:hypothetical protein